MNDYSTGHDAMREHCKPGTDSNGIKHDPAAVNRQLHKESGDVGEGNSANVASDTGEGSSADFADSEY